MFYYLFYDVLREFFTPFNVFGYITFRAGGAVLTSLIISLAVGPYFIKKMTALKVKQTIRNDGPKSHQTKNGTPTMGGALILISIIVSVLLWARIDNRFILFLLFATIYLGFLGFLDDYLKLIKKNSKGISARGKLFWQTLLALSVALFVFFYPPNAAYASSINIPFSKEIFINLSYFYIVFAVVEIVGSSNAVNLTDGLDGLAVVCIIIVSFSLALFAYFAGHIEIANYLKIIPVSGAGEISVFLFSVVGAGLGFLWFNSYPAEIFMGDTGSLFLGGVLGISSVFIKQELILILLGGIFVVEALSVLIQVFVFKKTKKRIFKMAPLHHHFELGGLPEPKVTVRFWIIGIVLAILSFASLKLR
ncbi:MAG: phospho-N-acetylmuramoyl-pentapeptide-transferase [Elusimicrobiota bacterium]|jgi:phospho-N-acetylmuramoyl-pentapeptide-transferase|nr:phospho-N-acetylmuramoyl-pentapeptide-transferase [Elusimicrobiota bacterium]